jgi:hypothetical protein
MSATGRASRRFADIANTFRGTQRFDSGHDEAAARKLWAFAAAVVGLLLIAETAYLVAVVIPANWELGQDYVFYRDVGSRWLADGSYYLPRQVEGPYVVRLMEDVLYPPSGLFLFVPTAILGPVFYWLVPVAVTLYVIRGLNPAPWTWVVMLVLLCYPRAIGAYLFGNTDIWAVAGIAAGIRWGWPAVLLLIKPTFAPFALVGIRHRSWWVAGILLGLASLPMLPLWFDYLDAARFMRIDAGYSLGSLPLLLIPLVAWSGRRPEPLDARVEVRLRDERALEPHVL